MKLNIIVCIKAVTLQAPEKSIVRSSDSCVLNPFDRPALELALRLREKSGGTITALSMGPESCSFALQEAMALGVDAGVLISDPKLSGSDTLATSSVLAAALKKMDPFDLVLFGTRTADSDTGHVGPQAAVLLELPMVTWVYSVEQQDAGLLVERRIDGFRERFEILFPAGLTIHPSALQIRDLGLSGIQMSFEKGKMTKWCLNDLELSPSLVGEAGSPTSVNALSRIKRERKCEFLDGTAEEQVTLLLDRLLAAGLVT